ncbi:FGGY family carbohydrate kinase [Streptantibioticus ferralitis]|uniref:FGGY family carbohydrate kinase n=1 Tax=Streptantibioticus ferralitis TaxID=236510 RepID=A0ABT5ZBT6_9ACTN|nr:FGGY family carbohydrate kinase [Streptantibioticus ferralitis]
MAGIDSSTQSCKIVVCDADTGKVPHRTRATHSEGTEVDPEAWWQALCEAGKDVLEHDDAASVAGQQHGMVAVDDTGHPVRDALLWNDTRSARAAAELIVELGGPIATSLSRSPIGSSRSVTKAFVTVRQARRSSTSDHHAADRRPQTAASRRVRLHAAHPRGWTFRHPQAVSHAQRGRQSTSLTTMLSSTASPPV